MAKGRKPNLPQSQSEQANHVQVVAAKTSAATFSGPLPPPALLQGYENIKPGFAERIVQMAEGEANHRREQEKKPLMLISNRMKQSLQKED